MRKTTENHGNFRTLAEYMSPRSKVKDLTLQQHSLPHDTSFHQETPMKPSQMPNQLSHPPPKRGLSLQSPELYQRERLGPRQHSSHHLGPIHSSDSPANVGNPTNRPHHTPRDRLGPPQHSPQPPGPFCSSHCVQVSPPDSDMSANSPQPSPPGVFHHASPQFMRDLSNYTLSFHIRRDELSEAKARLSHSGSRNVIKNQESNKAQSSDMRNPVPTAQLHRRPVTPSLNTRTAQEVLPQPLSDSVPRSPAYSHSTPHGYQPSENTHSCERSSCSSLSISPAAPCQDQQHKETPSHIKLIPVFYSSSWKRCKEIEDCDHNAKKLCLPGGKSGKAQTPKPTVNNSVRTSPVSPSRPSSATELRFETTDNHQCSELAREEPSCLELSSTFGATQSSCGSLSLKPCAKGRPSIGAKQAYISSTQDPILKLKEFKSSSNPAEESLQKNGEENNNTNKLGFLLSPEVPQRLTRSLAHVHRRNSVSPVKKVRSKTRRSSPKSESKPNSGYGRSAERNKIARSRRPVVTPDDTVELFTPDPMTYVVSAAHKSAKPKKDGGTIKSPTSEKSCSSSTAVTGSLCRKTPESSFTHAEDTKISSSGGNAQFALPTVALERLKLENIVSFGSKDRELKNGFITSSGKRLKEEPVKSGGKRTLKTETTASERTSISHCSQPPPLERQESEGNSKQENEEDAVDVELDLGLSFALDLDVTQSSHSSEEGSLLSLQEMMKHATKLPDTPEKGAFLEPSTPGHHSSKLKFLLPSSTKPGLYKNNLDQMLKEINTNKKAKEIEVQLLTACQEDLLRIAEYETEEKREEGISTEQQEFLQRYSLTSSAIRDVPPGETVFNMEKFGQIFNQDTLQLRQCMVTPQGTAKYTLLWSSPAQLRLHVMIGLFQEAYNCSSPCPAQITRFLFKMMSVHSERLVSKKILQALCDIACTAVNQIVKNGSQEFKLWVPSLADVTLVLMNMGVAFVTLFPFENLQPPFTEGDLLEDISIQCDIASSNKEQRTVPEHNYNNVLKYLSFCMGLNPRAYSDDELLLLLTVVGKVCLDTQLILQSSVELFSLQYKIVNNIRGWDTMLPRICQALTDLTKDHHNMCLLVQLLPDNTRGKQLRQHLSLSMISKLLDGKCTSRRTGKDFQLSMLRPYLPSMQPSALFRRMLNSSSMAQNEKVDKVTLDQQSYYLCYSLLTLTSEASNFQFFPAHQKGQLLALSSELETHIKCDIRESEKCLYRSKVKDLVARIDTKWQMLLQKIRPLHGKLYDYWQPPPVDTLVCRREECNSDDGQGVVILENKQVEETNQAEEDEAVLIAEEDEAVLITEADEAVLNTEEEQIMELGETHGGTEGLEPMDEKNETKEAIEPVPRELNQEVEDDNLVHMRQTSDYNLVSACDKV
ncbi:SMC5-SMC6 complex localization factor protein 2 isoform X3 [Hippoglossus hippoglossus]|uniref:SMC5-SMC6 complex localization factor protein 2 isoform X3 n=1 Tax=Hippoglossus hippoglossus TaxID=8267 RepID=UPI00148C04F6|nr:SMC5-SMC6 complex localization factor protein 2 isoform X3 [Hippoglossus hippoglossus]